MTLVITPRILPIHRRINPADYTHDAPTLEVTVIEKALVEMFRELDNADKTQIMRDTSLAYMAAKRVRRNDAERGIS